ncbi:MAG: DUF5320 domain-containing protein [Bacteroidales bacterium]
MPGRDRRGPLGAGPLTGRRMGYCAGNEDPDPGHPMGFGFGRRGRFSGRRGRGYGDTGPGYRNYPVFADLHNKEALDNEIGALKEQLSFLEKTRSKMNEET